MSGGSGLLTEAGFELVENPGDRPFEPGDLFPHLPNIDAAISGVEVWDEQILSQAPRLKVIARLGVGLDNIDLEAAGSRGIAVTNVPGGNANAVAELVVGLLITLQRKIAIMGADIRQGRWDRYVGTEITGKTVALVGYGTIAQLVHRRLRGFDVKVVAHDPYADPELARAAGVALLPLSEALGRADIVSIHAPEHPGHPSPDQRRSPVGDATHAVLINTSRGGLIDEAALFDALTAGRIAGAALDVWEREPVTADNPLLGLPNVVATTHAAADTREAYHTVGMATATAILDVFRGVPPQNLRNRPVGAAALAHL